METKNTTPTATSASTLDLNRVFASSDFENAVVKIASIFGLNVHSDIYPDVRQAAAIACIDAARLYKEELCGGNFLGYAYQRMMEYVKNEVADQRNIVHIPYHRRTESGRYSKVTHEYYDLYRPNDGHEHGEYSNEEEDTTYCFDSQVSCASGLSIDIERAVSRLNDDERAVFELMHGMREFTVRGKRRTTDSAAVAAELGIPVKTVESRYNSAMETVREYFA